MKLYLDDERPTPPGWERAFTAKESIEMLEFGDVHTISLDHDLGCTRPGLEETGYTVLKWIEEQAYADPDFRVPIILVHSANQLEPRR